MYIFHSQMFEFSVNTESNEKGDFLLHIACRSGICQLPLILSLVRLQNADVDLCNAEGMTPLMIASEGGDSVLCDVSIVVELSICHLLLILSLVQLQNADIDLCNAEGIGSILHISVSLWHHKQMCIGRCKDSLHLFEVHRKGLQFIISILE